jgi:hypothetical protein
MNRKDLDALNELYLSVYDGEQLNEAPLTPEQIRYKNERAQLGVISKGGKFVATGKVDPKLTSEWEWMTSSGAGRRQQLRAQKLAADLNKGQREAAIAAADKAEKPFEYNSKNLGDKQNAEFRAGGGNAAVGDSYTAADVVARGRAALKAKAETASGGSGGSGGSNRPAPPKGPVLSKKDGVEGTGVGANFKARAFSAAEKSRYASVAAQNAARTSASSGAATPAAAQPTPARTPAAPTPAGPAKPAIGTTPGGTKFERRTPTSSELRAAQAARAEGKGEEGAVKAGVEQGKADNIVKSGAVAALKPAAPTPSPAPARNGFGASTAPMAAKSSVSSATGINNKKPITPVKQESYEWPSAKTIRDIAGAYASIYEAKKKVDQDEGETNRWWDDDGDGVGYEKGEVSGKFKKKKKVTKEELELWVNELLEEGYDLSEYTWDDMFEIYEATAMAKRGYDETEIRNRIAKSTGGGEAADRATALENRPTYGNTKKETARKKLARTQRGDFRDTTSSNSGLHGYAYKSNDPAVKAKQAARGAQRGVLTPNEKKELNREAYAAYEFVASYLLENNFASTVDDANVIINNMSEGWFESIMEDVRGVSYNPNPIGNAIRAGAGLLKNTMNRPSVQGAIKTGSQMLQKSVPSGGYSTREGDGKPRETPLWDGPSKPTPTKPKPTSKPPMRDEPLW